MRRILNFLLPPFLALCITLYGWQKTREMEHAASYGEADIGGNFHLIDTHGDTVTQDSFKGKPMLVYFGFSNCPDICPMTLTAMSETLKLLGSDAYKVTPIFITVDPLHDRPDVLKKYLTHFDKRIVGLTGDQDDINDVAAQYKVFFKATPVAATGKTLFDHSGFIYLMDNDGKYVKHFDTTAKPEEIASAIRKLI